LPNRVCFLVDGFNLYHSIIEALEVQPAASMKWLDLLALCRSYLSAIGRDATLERIFYFSALPEWRPDKMARQAIYVAAFKTTGVEVQLGRFKEKEAMCFSCGATFKRHEEKETDVAVAVKLMELFLLNACDTVVLVTGDTDLAPAIRTAKVRWPEKKVWALFPFGRHNAELKAIAHGHIKIKANAYLKSQIPNPIKISDAELLWKPTGW